MGQRVVITGMGVLSPIGENINDFWNALTEGKSGVSKITKFDPQYFKTSFAAELKDFNVSDHFDRKEARKYDPYCHYALVASREAMNNAGLTKEDIKDPRRAGVIWSSANGGITTFEQGTKEFFENPELPRFSPFFIPRILVDTASGLIAMEFGLMGINYCPVSACASSTAALIEGFRNIKEGRADVMIAGGSEAPITYSALGGFSALKALSTRNDAPEKASRPFDRDRDGFVMAEGAGALILESLEHAQARGANILAEITGGGMSADAYHMTATHPEGEGAVWSMEQALNESSITVNELDHINAHATSTPVGDISELNAIKKLTGDRFGDIPVTATKSITGHLLGAAGAIEGIALAKTLIEQTIPGTINLDNIDENLPEGSNIVKETKSHNMNYALSNTFGFGGHNASIVMKKWNA
ncbi:beta-ketoacyl-ACP synthase II [Marinigracilibium pacificum]|uniref:3-oxoacyl-[acyl-carrier-protein] synthase 2 n=1 Tax=Marinigracilibium pacificum TaxID=2729599 RepID=A0A848IYX7_9BACT|nr:beta-ketoacyl-ACP synthase II [Marinigracilibium pacificum]NMM49733.1 beta-ketoacyl-ACP synthase II [Marinigracilibium pacificum]